MNAAAGDVEDDSFAPWPSCALLKRCAECALARSRGLTDGVPNR